MAFKNFCYLSYSQMQTLIISFTCTFAVYMHQPKIWLPRECFPGALFCKIVANHGTQCHAYTLRDLSLVYQDNVAALSQLEIYLGSLYSQSAINLHLKCTDAVRRESAYSGDLSPFLDQFAGISPRRVAKSPRRKGITLPMHADFPP